MNAERQNNLDVLLKKENAPFVALYIAETNGRIIDYERRSLQLSPYLHSKDDISDIRANASLKLLLFKKLASSKGLLGNFSLKTSVTIQWSRKDKNHFVCFDKGLGLKQRRYELLKFRLATTPIDTCNKGVHVKLLEHQIKSVKERDTLLDAYLVGEIVDIAETNYIPNTLGYRFVFKVNEVSIENY